MNIKFYFPRWIFPNNIGDSINVTFIPKILKQIYPNSTITVITQGFLIDLFKLDPNVESVREPEVSELKFNYYGYAMSNEIMDNQIKVIYPEWHPKLFSFWKENHEKLVEHPTANIIIVNFLLQLKLEHLLFDSSFNFQPICYIEKKVKSKNNFNIGIVVSTKLAGKNSPHPGCNGVGYRYKTEHWKKFVEDVKLNNNNVKIFEFSEKYLGIGDEHYGYSNSITELIEQIDYMDIGVMTDGGLHHVFNSRNKPIVLFQSNILSKVEFLKLGNSHYPENIHLECRKNCRSYFCEIFGGEDLSKKCNLECENLDPIKLSEYTTKIIKLYDTNNFTSK
jgi:hypothetical protein